MCNKQFIIQHQQTITNTGSIGYFLLVLLVLVAM